MFFSIECQMFIKIDEELFLPCQMFDDYLWFQWQHTHSPNMKNK